METQKIANPQRDFFNYPSVVRQVHGLVLRLSCRPDYTRYLIDRLGGVQEVLLWMQQRWQHENGVVQRVAPVQKPQATAAILQETLLLLQRADCAILTAEALFRGDLIEAEDRRDIQNYWQCLTGQSLERIAGIHIRVTQLWQEVVRVQMGALYGELDQIPWAQMPTAEEEKRFSQVLDNACDQMDRGLSLASHGQARAVIMYMELQLRLIGNYVVYGAGRKIAAERKAQLGAQPDKAASAYERAVQFFFPDLCDPMMPFIENSPAQIIGRGRRKEQIFTYIAKEFHNASNRTRATHAAAHAIASR